MHWYHKLNFALIGLGPVALMMPSEWTFPVDLALGFIIPLHSHLGARRKKACESLRARITQPQTSTRLVDAGGNDVTSDYAKKITKAPWFAKSIRGFIFGMTVVTIAGLTKLNLQVCADSKPECRRTPSTKAPLRSERLSRLASAPQGPGITEALKSLWRPKPELK